MTGFPLEFTRAWAERTLQEVLVGNLIATGCGGYSVSKKGGGIEMSVGFAMLLVMDRKDDLK